MVLLTYKKRKLREEEKRGRCEKGSERKVLADEEGRGGGREGEAG